MKVLVIGSKGFIGSHFSAYLTENNVSFVGADIVVDYLSTDYFILSGSPTDFSELFQKYQFDLCVNCSGAASVPDSMSEPHRDFLLNSYNVFLILDAIRKHQKKCKFINLSSAAVYGNPSELPISERNPCAPISPYGYHKMQSEILCKEYASIYSIPTLSLRIFSAYGEGLAKQLFWDLYRKHKLSKGENIALFGTGLESRDFIYIKDLVRLIWIVAHNAKFEGESINAANGIESSIHEVVDLFYSLFPEQVNFHFIGKTRQGDPSRWVADIETVRSFGYAPEYSLFDGLNNYYNWVSQQG